MKKILLVTISTLAFFACAAAEGAATIAAPLSAGVAAEEKTPAQPLNAVGMDIAMVSRIIPGISYTRMLDANASWSVFGGLIYDRSGVMFLLEANVYYLLNEYFYAGLGLSAALDGDNSAVFGLANPTAGLLSDITDNIKFYIETTVLIFTYRTKEDLDSNLVVGQPVPLLKLGVRYYF